MADQTKDLNCTCLPNECFAMELAPGFVCRKAPSSNLSLSNRLRCHADDLQEERGDGLAFIADIREAARILAIVEAGKRADETTARPKITGEAALCGNPVMVGTERYTSCKLLADHAGECSPEKASGEER